MIKQVATALVTVMLLSGCSSTGRGGKATGAEIADFEKNVGDRVFFGYDSSALSADAKETLTRQAAWLKGHKHVTVTVEGHCDERGTREYNLALGERRASAAQGYLVEQGVDATRVDTVSYGKERPAVIGNTEEAWKQNRRGVTSIK